MTATSWTSLLSSWTEGAMSQVLVRREQYADVLVVREVVDAAFREEGADDEPIEVTLLDLLRASQEWIPALSLVAEAPDGSIAGHVVCTRGWIGDVEVVGLGPIAVRPDLQRRGIGSALMHAVVAATEALDVPAVVLLGSTDYYPRFGFVPGTSIGITAPEPRWGDHFQVRLLCARDSAPRGPFRYAQPFRDIG